MSICITMPDPDLIYQETLDKLNRTALATKLEANRHNLIRVDIDRQRLTVYRGNALQADYSISSSRFGVGQSDGSHRTPLGIHRISEKFGDNEPSGTVFKARQPLDRIVQPGASPDNEDVITSRIIRLDGLQYGFNRDGDSDSHKRYIYIHGTQDEAHIGQPASIGCIRMYNSDVIALYEMIEINDLVVIV